MAKTDVWPVIRAERKALAVQLDGISDGAWGTRSLCSDWTVRDVLAHMTATSKMSGASFFPRLIGSGFSLKKMQAKDITRERGSSGPEALVRFTSQLDSTGRPPGPVETMLGEVLVHSADIRRPLGLPHAYQPDALKQAADFYKRSNLILGTKKRIAGLRLRATDVDWSHGDGPPVEGPMLSLLLAMTGRQVALDDLTGEGIAVLRSRPQHTPRRGRMMAKYLVLYRASTSAQEQMSSGTSEQAQAGMELWMQWAGNAGSAIVEMGSPLQSVATVGKMGLPSIGGFSILEGDNPDALRELLDDHPHFHSPGDTGIEVLEFLPIQGM